MFLVYVSVLVNERFKFISADVRKRTCSTLLSNTYVWNTIAVLLDREITAHSYGIIKNILWKESLCNF